MNWNAQQGGATTPTAVRDGNAYVRVLFFNPVVTTGNAGLFSCQAVILNIPSRSSIPIVSTTEAGHVNIQSNATQ